MHIFGIYNNKRIIIAQGNIKPWIYSSSDDIIREELIGQFTKGKIEFSIVKL